MSANNVVSSSFNGTRVQVSAVSALAKPSKGHDAAFVWDAIFDRATNTIRIVRV